MMMALIRKELRESLWKTVVGLVIMTVLGVATVLLYEMMKDLFTQIPGEMGWIQNILPPGFLDNFSFYVWGNWHGKNLYQIGTLVAVLLGMSAVSGEVSANTIGFLLTRPVSRKTVFVSKVTAGTISLALVIGISTAMVIGAATLLTGFEVEAGRLFATTLITALGLFVIYSLAVFFSTLFDDSVKAGGATLIVLLAMSVLNWFSATRRYSLFSYITGRAYFLQGELPLWPIIAMVAASAVLLAAGMRALEKKEL